MTVGDPEFQAMQTLFSTLEPLDEDARGRVLDYIVARLPSAHKPSSRSNPAPSKNSGEQDQMHVAESAKVFNTFAELNDAAQPKTNADKALVAGYWLQVCEGSETFDAQSANTALKHLGEGLANITNAIDSLKNQKPALALQLRKSGKTQQARKVYKITVAGVKAVKDMIDG